MQYTFGVIIPGSIITSLMKTTVPIVRICGSLPELGAWSTDRAPAMTLRTKEFYSALDLVNEPRLYRLDIELPKDIQEFNYKYLINDQHWEGREKESRQWKRNDSKYLVDQAYYTPIDYWIDTDSGVCNEKSHTGRFYNEIASHQLLHCGRVNDQLYVGTCPRLLSHITDELAKKLGITAVINLQVMADIERNCVAIYGAEKQKKERNEYDLEIVETMKRIYEQSNILFIWMPITDFSSIGREMMSPQAALVLKTMLEKGHRVYVHCNAGVGRAFGLICAYYHFVLKIPLPIVQYELTAVRSCGYFDWPFLENAAKIYRKAFE